MKNFLVNIEHYKMPRVQYGGIIDPGGGGGDPFPGGDPGSGGGGGGGGGDGCYGYVAGLAAGAAPSTALISSSITNIDATHRTIRFTWIPYRGPLGVWRYESRDLGTQEKVDGTWQWTDMTHQSITLAGTTTGYTLTYTDINTPDAGVFNVNTAYVELNFRVRLTTYCNGAPFEFEMTSSPYEEVRKTFPV